MLNSSIPIKFNIPWANSAGGGFIRPIPQASQIGITNGAASLTDGFPPLNFTPIASGGVPPFGQDFNGIFNQVTAWIRWYTAGGSITYDSAFATAIGGYPKNAIIGSNVVAGRLWMSTADGNTTDPDSLSSANWATPPGQLQVGSPAPLFTSAAPAGLVRANAQTIGNASSNATERANADTLLLYRFVWTNFSNTQCPLQNSSGTLISRGVNADADFNANNRLSLPDARGASIIGIDTMGGSSTTQLSGVPVTNGNTTTPGSILGENLHLLSSGEMPSHNHGYTDPTHVHPNTVPQAIAQANAPPGGFCYSGFNNSGAASIGITISNTGGGATHNTVHRAMTATWGLSL